MSKLAIGYVRVSSEPQAEKGRESLPEQAARLRKLAEAKGFELLPPLPEVEVEGMWGDVFSGEELERRPGVMAVLARAREGGVSALLVDEDSRLARDELVAQLIRRDLAKAGVKLVTLSFEYDFADPMHLTMFGFQSVGMASWKRMMQGALRRGRDGKARKGGFPQAVRCFGYSWEKAEKRPVLVEAEAEVVREIFSLAAQHHTPNQIAGELGRRGFRRRRDGAWTGGHIRAMLTNPAYMGDWMVTASDGEVYDVAEELRPPAIVDGDTWAQAQRGAKARRRHRRPWVKREWLLSGFLSCGNCGRALTIRCPDEEHRYYACNTAANHRRGSKGDGCDLKHIPAHLLEQPVWQYVLWLSEHPEVLEGTAEETRREVLPELERRLLRVYEGKKDWQKRERAAREAFETGDYTSEQFRRTQAEYELHMADLDREQEDLEAGITAAQDKAGNLEQTRAVLAEDLGILDLAGRRRKLSQLGIELEVTTEADAKGKLRKVKALFRSFGAAWAGDRSLATADSFA